MSLPPDPQPDPNGPLPEPQPVRPRIGDAERDRAVGYLQEHMAQGRLDSAEFDERLTRALQARTEADLHPLFEDLPEPRPSTGLATTAPVTPPWASGDRSTGATPLVPTPEPGRGAPRQHMPRAVTVALAAVWPAAVLLALLIGFQHWWVWIAAAMITYFLRQAFAPEQPPDDQQGPPAVGR